MLRKSIASQVSVVEFHNAGIIRKVLRKSIAITPVTECRNGIVFFVVLWNSIARWAIRYFIPLLLALAFYTVSSPVFADHGPATTGAGFLLPSAEIIPPGHLDISARWQNINYMTPSEGDLRASTIRMGNVGDHYDSIGNGELATLAVAFSISEHWDLQIFGGWYTAREIRIGLIDGRGDYKLVDAGGISGFTDPGASGRYQIIENNFLKFTVLAGFTAPLGRSTTKADYRNLNDLPILSSLQPNLQTMNAQTLPVQNNISPHLVPGTELAVGGGSFALEPTMTPGQKTWSFNGGIALAVSLNESDVFTFSFRYTDWLSSTEMRPGRRMDFGIGFPAFSKDNLKFNVDLLYRHRDRSRSNLTVLQNSGGQELLSSISFQYIINDDYTIGTGIAIPVWQINNGPQQKLGILFSADAGVRIHFE